MGETNAMSTYRVREGRTNTNDTKKQERKDNEQEAKMKQNTSDAKASESLLEKSIRAQGEQMTAARTTQHEGEEDIGIGAVRAGNSSATSTPKNTRGSRHFVLTLGSGGYCSSGDHAGCLAPPPSSSSQ